MKKYLDKNNIEISQQEFLYGKCRVVMDVPIILKLNRDASLRHHLNELLDEPLMTRQTQRIKAVGDAIDFWEDLT